MGILRLPDGMVAVARVVKSYGTAGEVIVKFDSTYAEYMYDLAELPLFMEFEGAKVPFSIESLSPKGRDGAIVKFSTINDLQHAEELVRMPLFASAESIAELLPDMASIDEQSSLEALAGFSLFDGEGNFAGKVVEFLDYPSNPCLEVERPGGERVVIPIHTDLVLGFDAKARELTLEIPKGLFSL